MQLAKHLQNFAEIKYHHLMIHAEFAMQDRYVFTTNRLLNNLNQLAHKYNTKVEIINIEYADFDIPVFILLTAHTALSLRFNDELETFFDLCQIAFMTAFMQSYFLNSTVEKKK